jgi:hypothetical protein
MVAHCIIYTAFCTGAFKLIGVNGNTLVYYALVVGVPHYFIDKWKCRYATEENFPTWHLYVDQIAHLGILLGILIGMYQNGVFPR